MPDNQLLADCRWEAFRGPGPGGQKRNKTSSAVRITHLPTGLSAIATESRSQH
jgi:protein subunit release factor B